MQSVVKGPLASRLGVAAALFAATLTASDEPQGAALQAVAPPAGYLYHGVYPGGVTGEEDDLTPADVAAYEQAAGKRAAWVYFSHNWYKGRAFPAATAAWIRNLGSVPYVRLMLRSDPVQGHAEPTFTLARIVAGEFDADLRAWGRGARDFGSPLLAEYGTEVNGEWFSWNGVWNGGGATGGYGDPAEPDGPERFRDAYRHIVALCREEGASNLTWVFHVNAGSVPDEWWNTPAMYYPGDEWVDWLAVSAYGAQTPLDEEWPLFRLMLDEAYPVLAALSATKPIVVAEFAVTAGNPLGEPGAWADAALADLTSGRWPRIVGFSWWNEWWQNDDVPAHDTDMRVQANAGLRAAFRSRVGQDQRVLGRFLVPHPVRRNLSRR